MSQNTQTDITVQRKVVRQFLEGKSTVEIFLDETLNHISLEKIKEIEILVRNDNPLVKMDDTGRASVLNYNVPNSISYKGLLYLVIQHPKLGERNGYDWFKQEVKE